MDHNYGSGYASQPQGYPMYSNQEYSGSQNRSPSIGEQDLSQTPYYGTPTPQSATESFGYSSSWQSSPTFSDSFQQNGPETIKPKDLKKLIRSTHEVPWSNRIAQSAGGSIQQTAAPTLPGGSFSTKANTVAAGAEPSHLRPQFSQRLHSFAGTNDSGFESAQTGPSIGEFKTPFRRTDHFSTASQYAYEPTSAPRPPSVKSDSYLQVPPTEAAKRKKVPRTPVAACPVCGKVPKNQSDALKHEYQHTRPFQCFEFGCTREKGFATNNDLERHRKSMHGATPSVGEKDGYTCKACPDPGIGSPRKWWPRKDNFWAHIRRKHPDWNIEWLIQNSKCSKPDDAISESGYASHAQQSLAPDEQDYQDDFSSPVFAFPDFDQSQVDAFAGMGGAASIDSMSANRDGTSHLQGSVLGVPYGSGQFGAAASMQAVPPLDHMMLSPLGHPSNIPNAQSGLYTYGDEQPPQFNQIAWSDGGSKRRRLSPADGEHIHIKTEDGRWLCSSCKKTKKRECDLRKHMKRHTRPYGCTFPQCLKRFGSRNDWKRHENTQHSLKDMWRCELARSDRSACGRLANKEVDFATHLLRRHGLAIDSDESKGYRKSMHLGREGHHQFWCGFCCSLVKQEESSQVNSWEARAKHIGDHFDKDNYHIHDWVDIEENKKKKLITTDDRRRAKVRATQRGRVEDDSDLVEDGIPPFVSDYKPSVTGAATGYDPDMSAQASVYS